MAKLNEDLLAALYMLGFNIYGGEVAEIKGAMSIKVLRPCSSELKQTSSYRCPLTRRSFLL